MPDIFVAVQSGDPEQLHRLVQEDPTLAEAKNEQGVSIVLWTLYHRRTDLVKVLLEVKPDLDLLERAALGHGKALLEELEQEPESLGSWSGDGFSPLHLAAYFGRTDSIRILLNAGADLEAVARNGSDLRPLHSAVAGGEAAAVELLLEAGAETDPQQQGGFTPLMGAAIAGRKTMVEALLERGADASLKCDDGKTAADLAQAKEFPQLAQQLRDAS